MSQEKPMTVKELKEILSEHPDNMEILFSQFSDYSPLQKDDISVVSAVDKDFYWMRSHPTMNEECQSKKKDYLCFPGN